jgi:hypothetical protein
VLTLLQTKKILIGGDSWGCGEWAETATGYGIRHRGLEQYLIDDNVYVVNVARGGQSNSSSIEQVINQLDLQGSDFFDTIIWFQTDPIRDLSPYSNFSTTFVDYFALMNKSNELLHNSYQQLNQLGVNIVCIGGCSKLLPEITEYKNLNPIIPSMIEFLEPALTAPDLWHSDWINCVNGVDIDFVDKLLVQKKLQNALGDYKIFQPDGGHANRYGHRMLYDYLKNQILI